MVRHATLPGRRVSEAISLVTAPIVLLLLTGCSLVSQPVAGDASPWVERAQAFRSLLQRQDYGEARKMMSDDPRRWFAPREGRGDRWEIGPRSGPWSEWDAHFRSEGTVIAWREGERSATAVVQETNDYFRLLERGVVTNEITYFFDDSGMVAGLLIATAGARPPGLTEEFLAWAREHEPRELEALMPGGEIDPSGDHPQRFRALLNRWRAAIGKDPITYNH